jgi:hypothetical protein
VTVGGRPAAVASTLGARRPVDGAGQVDARRGPRLRRARPLEGDKPALGQPDELVLELRGLETMCSRRSRRTCSAVRARAARAAVRATGRSWAPRLPRRLRSCGPTRCRVRSTCSGPEVQPMRSYIHAKIDAQRIPATTHKRKRHASPAFLPSAATRCSRAPRPLRDVHDNEQPLPHRRASRRRSTRAPSKWSRTAIPPISQLRLRADSHASFMQWFHFRLQGARGQPCASASSTRPRRPTSRVGAATRRSRRTTARRGSGCRRTFDGRELAIAHEPARDSIYYAYFEPYPWERHLALLGARSVAAGARARSRSDRRRARHEPRRGRRARRARKPIWVIARQHPGETMAEWFVDGMLERLLDYRRSAGAAPARARRCCTWCPT